jgi:hypothetical protein
MHIFNWAAAAAFMLAATAVPAHGAVIINSDDTGYKFTVAYSGLVGGQTTPSVSALGTYTFNGVTNKGLTYNFGYSLLNDSTTTARLSGFAFNTSPNPTDAEVTGAFDQAYASGGKYPESFGSVDFCFTDAGGSCAGSGRGGYYENETGTGTFALSFAKVMTSVEFDSFVTRFQSIDGVKAGDSGIGIGALVQGGGDPITAPEPGTWLMMMIGFGFVGLTMRRHLAATGARSSLGPAPLP